MFGLPETFLSNTETPYKEDTVIASLAKQGVRNLLAITNAPIRKTAMQKAFQAA